MNNSNNTKVSSPVEDITQYLNLNNFKGQHKAKNLLRCLVNAYYEEKRISNKSLLPKIVLLGPTGKEAFASATHNSLGNLNFIHIEASYLNCSGDDIIDILKNCTRYDTVYISNASQLNKYAQNFIWKYLTCGEIEVVHFFEGTKETFVINDFCLILGTETLQGISKSLHNLFTHCILTYYAPLEIIGVLKQRCDYYKIRYTADKVFEIIAEQVDGRARKAVKLLELSTKFMLADGKDKISLLHVNRALTGYRFAGNGSAGK